MNTEHLLIKSPESPKPFEIRLREQKHDFNESGLWEVTYNDFFANHGGFRFRVGEEEKPTMALINEHRKKKVLFTILVEELPN